MQPPDTRYTTLGDVQIAYQVFGKGPPDVVMVPLFASHLDLQWTDPALARMFRHVASNARVIMFDMPGTGLSDRVTRVPTLDERAATIEAVLDAAGSQQAAICGTSEGGQASMLFAATRPERTTALILYATFPKIPGEEDLYELLAAFEGPPTDERMAYVSHRFDEILTKVDHMVDHWGEGYSIELVKSPPHSAIERRFWAVFERAAISRSQVRAQIEAVREFDVMDILPTIRVPTLVMHPKDDPVVPIESGRFLAARIPGAKFVETYGIHHALGYGDQAMVVQEIERFLTGQAHEWNPDRAFVNVLFTDIVESTDRAAELGDSRWREILGRHDAIVADCTDRFGGDVIKQTGDGCLAGFDNTTEAIECAEAICRAVKELGIEVRAGVHSGECELVGNDLAGLTVHIGARVAALAAPGEVLVSRRAKDLVFGSGLAFADRGMHRLKGVPDEWDIYALRSRDAAASDTVLRPAPADDSTRRDRALVGLVTRTPRTSRAMARLIRWRPASRQPQPAAESIA